MVQIVVAGIGYGDNKKVEEWCLLPPTSLSSLREELKEANLNIRDVLGYVPVVFDNFCSEVILVNNNPQNVQKDSVASKGVLGNITPYGGKVDGEYLVLAEKGLISIDRAYSARGFCGEMDEFGGAKPMALKLLNRVPGLLSGDILSSPNGRDLYINRQFVMEFRPDFEMNSDNPESKITKFRLVDEDISVYQPLDNILVSYAIGLNAADKKNGKFTATAVANVWPLINSGEVAELTAANELDFNGAKGVLRVPLSELGSRYPTTVSNMVACGLLTSSPETYQQLTGSPMPAYFPGKNEIGGLKDARFSEMSLGDLVKRFYCSLAT
ncbi:hypothetical protein HYT55_04700 [Candidatus Woesearchaeota archaeon]|nr:hypothetical protein [Candidatus Woesearchaeota archaeon]